MSLQNPHTSCVIRYAAIITVATACAASPIATFANEPRSDATYPIDLDKDGVPEIAQLKIGEDVTLEIIAHGTSQPLASSSSIGWSSGPMDLPILGMNSAGSLTVTSEHLNGPSKYSITLVIAYRDHSYKVVGVTYEQWGLAFADPETGEIHDKSCDMNLLTQRGVSNFSGSKDVTPRKIDLVAPALEDWRWEMIGEICGAPTG